ncbi:MAG: tetratricopeptide repeat protein [Acidobacteriota bacterium]
MTSVLLFLTLLSQDARLDSLRNLGKAFYENPTTQKEAVTTLKQALDLAPTSPRERLNYGLALLRAGQSPAAITELLAVQKQRPDLPHTWFTLGIEYKKQGESEKALTQMQGALRLDPREPIIHYNLGVLFKQLGNVPAAIAAFEQASKLDSNLAGAHFQLFNLYRQSGRPADAKSRLDTFQSLKKLTEGAAVPEDVDWCQYSEIFDPNPAPPPRDRTPLRVQDRRLADAWLGVLPFGNSAIYWDSQGLSLNSKRIVAISGVRSVSSGDYDNDGNIDLCVIGEEMPILLRNTNPGWRQLPLPARGSFSQCVFLDYDHDYDLDLLILGPEQLLLRNSGEAGWVNRSQDFPFQPGQPVSAVVTRVIPDTRGFDLIVSYANSPGVLYRDLLLGKYAAEPLPLLPPAAHHLTAADIDQDGSLDLLFHDNLSVAWLSSGLTKRNAVPSLTGRAAVADLRNDGRLDIVAAHAALDLNSDGKTDLITQTPTGWVEKLNTTPTLNNSFRLTLEGVKNIRSSPKAEVELRIGGLYQKRLYEGFPLSFGAGKAATIDVVRITWPNGLIQNEMKQATLKPALYKEAQRLSGSCPIVWTWNGEKFEYVTDVLGVAPLGASSGNGTFFTPDHDEYITLSSSQLKPNPRGQLEIRLTEELSEAAYFDQLRLLAIDHPASTSIHSNEKWKSPPFPEFRLFGVEKPIHPTRATDHRGNDVTSLLAAKDRTYPNAFSRTTSAIAEPHSLTLDFGPVAPKNNAILVLSGWVDWADGSTFLAAEQSGKPLTHPSLQVKNRKGEWVTVIPDMGMPSGKPKSITVDLTGKFLSPSREVRILTNLCVYWDEIFLSEGNTTPQHRLTALTPSSASLQFRGFSPSLIHPERKQPEEFLYDNPEPTSLWNPTPGLDTRYGDVLPLATALDDRLIVMGSGDELRLEFDPSSLPALPAGWSRTYLLHVDGWAKDRDANTALSQNVAPLPFHSMSAYPYTRETSPGDPAAKDFNTRPALNLLRRLYK